MSDIWKQSIFRWQNQKFRFLRRQQIHIFNHSLTLLFYINALNLRAPLVRVWFYFPSLNTREKRQHMVDWAPSYSLTGFVLAEKVFHPFRHRAAMMD
jgi:hypothetical protein